MCELNAYQNAVKRAYSGGDHAYIESVDQAKEVGDTLFYFLMVELSESEECDSIDTALLRLEAAKRDIDDAIAAVYRLK